MIAFKFSLQKLLDAKEALEKGCEARMMEAMKSVDYHKRQLASLSALLDEQVIQVEKISGSETSARDLNVKLSYMNWVRAQIEAEGVEIEEANKAADEVRTELLEIIRDRKSLERLKEKERRQWYLDVSRKEQGAMDDMAVSAFLRKGIASA